MPWNAIARRCAKLVIPMMLPTLIFAQTQEIGLTLGGLIPGDRVSTANVRFNIGSGLALQADYEYRLLQAGPAALYIGAHFLASPQRQVTSADLSLTHDIASLYITPGFMVKLFPHSRVIPWGSIGGGYGDYEQSTTVLNGARNSAPRELSHGVFTYGGGLDLPLWRFVALRGEVRDFYTGNPAYNVPLANGQHNVTASAGFVLHFGRK